MTSSGEEYVDEEGDGSEYDEDKDEEDDAEYNKPNSKGKRKVSIIVLALISLY